MSHLDELNSPDVISVADHEALMRKQREHHRLRMKQEVDRLANDLAGEYVAENERLREALIAMRSAYMEFCDTGDARGLAVAFDATRETNALNAEGGAMTDGDGLLTCKQCTVRYAWASDYLVALGEIERLREAVRDIATTPGELGHGGRLAIARRALGEDTNA